MENNLLANDLRFSVFGRSYGSLKVCLGLDKTIVLRNRFIEKLFCLHEYLDVNVGVLKITNARQRSITKYRFHYYPDRSYFRLMIPLSRFDGIRNQIENLNKGFPSFTVPVRLMDVDTYGFMFEYPDLSEVSKLKDWWTQGVK